MVATDGACGVVKALLVDLQLARVEHLVVEPEGRMGLARLVPVALISEVEGDVHDGIDIDADLEAFGALPPAETSELVSGLPVRYSLYYGPEPVRREVHDVLPEGEGPLQPGMPVWAADGAVGVVAGLTAELPQYLVTGVLVRQPGHWLHHKTLVLPVGAVARVSDRVELNLTADEVAALP